MTGAEELAAILRLHARALGQNAHVILETRSDLRRLAHLLDPEEECQHQAYATVDTEGYKNLLSHRCLDCDHTWSTYKNL